MVTGSRIEGGNQVLTDRVRKTIQSIKEIVGNHSDADIYVALKEANMDPNETTQKLLNQDPFHEVKRKRDRKKESLAYKGFVEWRKQSENVGQGMKFRTFPERNVQKGGYARTATTGTNREFRIVRDNRANRTASREMKASSPKQSTAMNEHVVSNITEMGSKGTPSSQKPSGVQSSIQASNGPTDSQPRHTGTVHSSGTNGKEEIEEKQTILPSSVSRVQSVTPNNSQSHSATLATSNSVIGVYSSSTDPVHVPSPDSRSSSAVGAIKREVGVVGGRRQPSENHVKDYSAPSSSFSNSLLARDNSSESFRPFSVISKTDQLTQTTVSESVMPSISASRSFLSNQYGSRTHQQIGGHQKAPQQNKEWKPKSSQKSSVNGPGVIGTPKKSSSPPADGYKDLESEAAKLQDELSRVNLCEDQNVIIAEHIRVPEPDRYQLTFGSFGVEFDPSRNLVSGFHEVGIKEEANGESAASLSVSALEASSDGSVAAKPVDVLEDQVRNSESGSPESIAASEQQLTDKNEAFVPQNLDNYADIGLIRDNNPSFAPSEPQQAKDTTELQSFSAYDPQTGYDLPYFRPTMEETVRGQGLPSSQEAISSHTANSMPSSTMVQQQQPPMAQVYPPVHVSHFANLMPYRQFLSPIYVPQMAMPGYSGNPAYPHPSNGSSYLLMPGGSSHLSANGLKFGIQQFKPVPAGNPTGFGNFANPPGYAINAPGVAGSATGLEDSSRIKYKDGNLYVPNPQAEASEMWIQNGRELPGLQSTPYYNIPGQTPHAAYLPSHTGHASFNAVAAAQSSHMQFPGLFHPPQPAAMANPHHLGPAMGGNVGVGVAPATPGAQVGAYQQPQLGHLNWTTNF